MEKTNTKDKQVQELFRIVQEKKAAIAKAEKPSWATNCAFRYNKDISTSTNIQVCGDVDELTNMLGFLCGLKRNVEEAQEILGTTGKFKWLGFTFEEWSSDIKTRIDKIEIYKKKKELEAIEFRLDKLVSPEVREQMEIDEITKALSK